MPHVAALAVYPVKSCRGAWLDAARLGERGLEHDREWMVVDGEGGFLSQRSQPRLARVRTAVAEGRLVLSAAGHGRVEAALDHDGPARRVTVWHDVVEAVSAGAEAAAWLSDLLEVPCELVRMPSATVRPVEPGRVGPGHRVGFADAYPLLLLSEASLEDLNRRLERPVPMDRFRPNIVVGGCEPYAEDGWASITVAGIELVVAKPCARCVVVTTDQATGERSAEPLRTLASYRRGEGGVLFGQNLVHLGRGEIAVGDAVHPRPRTG